MLVFWRLDNMTSHLRVKHYLVESCQVHSPDEEHRMHKTESGTRCLGNNHCAFSFQLCAICLCCDLLLHSSASWSLFQIYHLILSSSSFKANKSNNQQNKWNKLLKSLTIKKQERQTLTFYSFNFVLTLWTCISGWMLFYYTLWAHYFKLK